MSGCYGNSAEDRHFERMCDKYTDDFSHCSCDVAYSEESDDTLAINGTETPKKDIEDNNYKCPECGEPFPFEDWY